MRFSTSLTFALVNIFLAQRVAASPVPIPEASKLEARQSSLNPAYLPDIKYFAQFSAAAYCDPDHVPGVEVTCRDGICPLVTANQVTTIIEFANILTDATGIVARDDSTRNIVIAIRGSQSVRNWIANAAFSLRTATFCSGCKSHTGFLASAQEVLPRVRATVNSLKQQYPNYGIVFTGHSLGGALATLLAADFRSRGQRADLFTYGAPRVGNQALSDFIGNSALGRTFRVHHKEDPVSRIPPKILGYGYINPEYRIKVTSANTQASDIEVIQTTTKEINLFNLNFDDHGYYLGPTDISACGDGQFEWKV